MWPWPLTLSYSEYIELRKTYDVEKLKKKHCQKLLRKFSKSALPPPPPKKKLFQPTVLHYMYSSLKKKILTSTVLVIFAYITYCIALLNLFNLYYYYCTSDLRLSLCSFVNTYVKPHIPGNWFWVNKELKWNWSINTLMQWIWTVENHLLLHIAHSKFMRNST